MPWSAVAMWALAMLALAWAAAPLAARLGRGLPDDAIAGALPLGLVLVAFVSWALAQIGVPYPRALAAAVAAAATLGVAGRSAPAARLGLAAPWLPAPGFVATFLAAFLGFTGLRALVPEIFGAEKLMDVAILGTLLRTDVLPPADPWLAGAPLHYYYGGYLLFAGPARLLPIAPEVVYHLALATVGAVLFTGAAALGAALAGRRTLGLLAGLAAAVLGNWDAVAQLVVEGRPLAQLDVWRVSRVVPDVIDEFPFWSLLHGDLHPHVSGLVVLIAFLVVVVSGTLAPGARLLDAWRAPAAVALLAYTWLANPWDLAGDLAVLGLAWAGVRHRAACAEAGGAWTRARAAVPAVAGAAVGLVAVAAAATAVAWPWLLTGRPPSQGLGRVHAQTALGPFLVVFGVVLVPVAAGLLRTSRAWLPAAGERRHFVVAALALALVVAWIVTASWPFAVAAGVAVAALGLLLTGRERADVGLAALAGAAAVLVAVTEVAHVRDGYGEQLHRMNTVFKLWFQAWVLLAIAAPALGWRAAAGRARAWRLVGAAAGALLVASGLVFPVAATTLRARSAAQPPTLDGLVHLARERPGDLAAVRWLRAHAEPGAVVLEATGDPYGWFGRIAAYSGVPTVLGWANHERVWRGDDPRIAERADAVRTLYTSDDAVRVDALLARYGVAFVVVGDLERRTYGDDRFARDPQRFPVVLRAGDTVVYGVAAAGRRTRTSRSVPAFVTAAVSASRTAMPSGRASGPSAVAVPSGVPSGAKRRTASAPGSVTHTTPSGPTSR